MRKLTQLTVILILISTSFVFSQEKVNIRQLKHSAKKGDEFASFKLGLIYEEGILVKQDPLKAFEYYEYAAEKKHMEAIGWMIDYYKTHNENPKMLFLWTEKGAELGDSVASFELSKMFETGVACEKNTHYRHFYCQKSAEDGYYLAQRELANMYFDGIIIDKSLEKGLQWMDSAANNGDTISQLLLADTYYRGEIAEQDIPKAIHFYSLAAKEDNLIAQVCLINHYSETSCFKNDTALYEYWYQEFIKNPSLDKSKSTELNIREYTKLAYEENHTAVLLAYWSNIEEIPDDSELRNKVLEKMAKLAEADFGSGFVKLKIAEYCYANTADYRNEGLILRYCKDAAKNDIPEAKTLLSDMYKNKYGLNYFSNKSRYYLDALEYDQNWAADSLVIYHSKGYSSRKSVNYFKEYKHLCSPQTYYFISNKHYENLYYFDSIEAFNYCKYASENGIPEAELLLAIYYYEGKIVEKDCKLAFEILNKNEMKEFSKTDYYLGLIYLNGCDINTDIDRAYELIKNSADKGYPDAQFHFAELVNKGKIQNISKEENLIYYENAAKGGNNEALIYVGKIYYEGRIVKKNDSKAFEYLDLANVGESAELHYILAKLYCEMEEDNPNKDMWMAHITCNWAKYKGYPGAKELYDHYDLSQYRGAMEGPGCCR